MFGARSSSRYSSTRSCVTFVRAAHLPRVLSSDPIYPLSSSTVSHPPPIYPILIAYIIRSVPPVIFCASTVVPHGTRRNSCYCPSSLYFQLQPSIQTKVQVSERVLTANSVSPRSNGSLTARFLVRPRRCPWSRQFGCVDIWPIVGRCKEDKKTYYYKQQPGSKHRLLPPNLHAMFDGCYVQCIELKGLTDRECTLRLTTIQPLLTAFQRKSVRRSSVFKTARS